MMVVRASARTQNSWIWGALGMFVKVCTTCFKFVTHLHLMIGLEAFVHALLLVNINRLAILGH